MTLPFGRIPIGRMAPLDVPLDQYGQPRHGRDAGTHPGDDAAVHPLAGDDGDGHADLREDGHGDVRTDDDHADDDDDGRHR